MLKAPADRLHQRFFDLLYARSLVYNTCWEDPAIDRQALAIRPSDRLAVITSAGCNVLDYALQGPREILAIDANPRQTALLELKIAAIRCLGFDDFFALFGEGRHPEARAIYHDALRQRLSPFAQQFWDKRWRWFAHNEGHSFYFHGLAGVVARACRFYLHSHPRLRRGIDRLLEARDLEEQRTIYDEEVEPLLWRRGFAWLVSRQATMSLLGVPCAQRDQVENSHTSGVAGFIRAALTSVFRDLSIGGNYFWLVYLRGAYTRTCCPEYLKFKNFLALRAGLVDCITPRTGTISQVLKDSRPRVDKFVLLDHMDWMAGRAPLALAQEWTEIFDCANPGARAIFRSASSDAGFLESVHTRIHGRERPLLDALSFQRELAASLHRIDRVHTYASFHIANLDAA